jgi:hypothetical protein
MSTASTNDDATVTMGTCRDNSGGPRRRPTRGHLREGGDLGGRRRGFVDAAAGCAVARTNHDTVSLSAAVY